MRFNVSANSNTERFFLEFVSGEIRKWTFSIAVLCGNGLHVAAI